MSYSSFIYKEILEKKNITKQKLEELLGLGNGVIGKAIDRNSKIKPERISKLLEIFPDLSKEWLNTGEGPMFNDRKERLLHQKTGQSDNAEVPDVHGYKDKYIQLLERVNEGHEHRYDILNQSFQALQVKQDKLYELLISLGNELRTNLAIAGDERREVMIVAQTTHYLLQQIGALTTKKPLQHFETISNSIRADVEQGYDESDTSS